MEPIACCLMVGDPCGTESKCNAEALPDDTSIPVSWMMGMEKVKSECTDAVDTMEAHKTTLNPTSFLLQTGNVLLDRPLDIFPIPTLIERR